MSKATGKSPSSREPARFYDGNVSLQPKRPTLKTNAFQNNRYVELFVECTDLEQLDTFSNSDPLCVLSVKKLGQWTEYERTESIPNNLHPKFVETFIIEANPTLYPRLQFSLYDLANFTSKDLRKHDYIGCVEIQLEHLLEQEYPVVRTLRIPGDVKSRGFIHIYVEEVVQSKTNVRLHFGGQHIEKNGFLGRNDSFFEVCRPLHGGHFHPVYRSEVVTRTNDPKWAPFNIQLQKLCNNNVDEEVKLCCWRYSHNGNHTLVGEARCTVDDLLKRKLKTVDIVNPKKKVKAKRYANSGLFRTLHCQLDKHFSLLDYVRGGCIIRTLCAIDFTLSNGDPTSPHSLHSWIPENNEYIKAIESLGNVLSSYDWGKRIPAFGFGAKTLSVSPSYCFPLDEKDPEPSDVQSLLDAYWKRTETIQLGGPTYLAPVIKMIAEYSQRNVSPQQYTVGCIIIDGVINDIDDTIDHIVQTGKLPLSLVVVGVGPADFRTMDELLSPARRPLRSGSGESLCRQNTYFVALRRYASNPDSMAREMFADVSRQILAFFKSKNIEPNLPQASTNVELDLAELNATERRSRPSSTRVHKRSSNQQTARCPTCGSILENNNSSF